MITSLGTNAVDQVMKRLREANTDFVRRYPGEQGGRQPVHTVYGGAQIFKADTAAKLGSTALAAFEEYAPDFITFARTLGFKGSDNLPKSAKQMAALTKNLEKNREAVRAKDEDAWLAYTVYERVAAKLRKEPVEDFRIDFEDGYGNRPDHEEDGHAVFAGTEVARGIMLHSLPPFIGIRLKPFTEELKHRSVRTLDIFVSSLLKESGGKLPSNFVITLPKVTLPVQVSSLVELLAMLEEKHNLSAGSLKMEIMVETPQSIINANGASALNSLVAAAEGRCVAAHFGVYDYTASCGITAEYQSMTHPVCDFARHMMKVALAGSGIWISDGATNVMPVGPHRAAKEGKGLSALQRRENREVVHRAWKLGFDHINHSLLHGYYQGWDLHPAQLPIRYAAVYLFFLEGLDEAGMRLKTFVEKAAQATLIGDVFDDAATGQGLLNFFLRALACRAITEDEASQAGLTLEELQSRSFVTILNGRRAPKDRVGSQQ